MWRYLVAYYWGFRDGWEQPYELAWSKNIEHLTSDRHDLMAVQEALDRGINMGQSLRGGRRSQADREGFVPFALRYRLIFAALMALNLTTLVRVLAEGRHDTASLLTVLTMWCLYVVLTGFPHRRHL